MVIIADESVDFAIIKTLRQAGYKVISIAQDSPGIDDLRVLDIANHHKGLLITEDKDFGELTYRLSKQHHGILLIRLSGIPRKERISLVCELFIKYQEKMAMNFSVITEEGLRIKSVKS
jgi:predicted nuclease of predicted toxin-antitoxin system